MIPVNIFINYHYFSTVIDMNDNAPKFEQPSYSCGLSQHAKRGQFVTIVTASDPDFIDHDSLIYKIAEGNELQTYEIDAMTGIISLINMQNFAENHMTVLNVSVTDGVYTSFTRVKINILPGNLHSPTFPHVSYDVKVNENQLAGRHVMTVSENHFLCVALLNGSFGRRLFQPKVKGNNSLDYVLSHITP